MANDPSRGRSVRAMELHYPTPNIQQVADRMAIHDALVRYCRGIDRLDQDLVRSAYWPDSTDNHGTYNGNGYEFAAYAIPRLRNAYEATQHVIVNATITFRTPRDATMADAETYVHAYHVHDNTVMQFVGRYVDRFEKRGDEWRIADRVVVYDWSRIDPIAESMPPEWVARFPHGRRDGSDTSYDRRP